MRIVILSFELCLYIKDECGHWRLILRILAIAILVFWKVDWNVFVPTSGNSVSELPLQAGDDAGQVQWVDIDSSFPLYANHSHFLELVAKERKAHW